MASTPGLPGSTSYFSGVRQTLTFRGGGAAQPGPLSPLIRPHSMLACHGSKRWTEEGCNSMLVSGDKWPLHRAYTWDGPPGLTPRRSGSRRGGYPQRRDWTRIVGASLLLQSEATPPLEARSDLCRRYTLLAPGLKWTNPCWGCVGSRCRAFPNYNQPELAGRVGAGRRCISSQLIL